jgi:DNA-directed RNA polymerase beta subunit
MKVIYNELSQEFKEKVGWDKPLRAEEKVEFQWLNIPVVKQNGDMLPIYGTKRIPSVDSVFDPWAKDEKGKVVPRMVQIAYIKRETGNEKDPYEFEEIEFKKADKCVITINGREPKKLPLLNYLRACNFNESNPIANKSESAGFLFKEMEPAKTAKQKIKEINEITSTNSYIAEMSESKLTSMLSALQQQILPTFEENQLALLEYVKAKQGRDKFNRLSTDVRMPIAALIGKAKELEKIRYEEVSKIWSYVPTGKLIIQVPPQTDATAHLVEYFHNNEHGKAFKEFLETEISFVNSGELLEAAAENLEKAEDKKGKKK